MAKQIKTIQCPQCGSAQQTKIKEDHYKCNSCGAEYFLDNDDININVRHEVNTSSYNNNTPKQTTSKTKVFSIIFIALALVTIFIIKGLNSSSDSSLGLLDSEFSGFDDNLGASIPFSYDNNTYLMIVSTRYRDQFTSGERKYASYSSIIDMKSKKMIKTERLEGVDKVNDSDVRIFSNNKIYFIINKSRIYELDTNNQALVDVTASMFEGNAEYISGIATLEFAYGTYGDGLKTITNNGKSFYYYPIVKKSYPESGFHNIYQNNKQLNANAKDSVYFVFSKHDSSNKNIDQENVVQLVKTIYKYNGGDVDYIDFSNIKATFVNGKTKYEATNRTSSFENFSPGRLFFKPYVVYQDKDNVLIKYNVTAAKESPVNLQKIDTKTGSILWTVVMKPRYDYHYFYDQSVYSHNKYYIRTSTSDYMIVNDDGSNVEYYTIKSRYY